MGTPEAAEGAQLVTQRFVRLCQTGADDNSLLEAFPSAFARHYTTAKAPPAKKQKKSSSAGIELPRGL